MTFRSFFYAVKNKPVRQISAGSRFPGSTRWWQDKHKPGVDSLVHLSSDACADVKQEKVAQK